MNNLNPKVLISVGFVLVCFGAAAPFLMVIGVLQSTFFLNFAAYGSSIVGLFLGLLGIASLRRDSDR